MAKKPSIGRQKIKIAKIETKNHLQVTFSKCRSGLFKKASELCNLCGVELAIIVFSPAGKVFSFGHPNVEFIVDRLLTPTSAQNSSALHLLEAHRSATVQCLTSQLTHVLNELEAETKQGQTLDNMRKLARQCQYWWEYPIDKLGLHELEQLRSSMEDLKKSVTSQANKLLTKAVNPPPFLAANDTKMVDHLQKKPIQIVGSSSTSNPHHVLQSLGYGYGLF